jgi:hypothetical protein
MTVDALVPWPLSTTLKASLLHMPAITGAGGAVDGAGRPYPILRGTAANCAGDADVMYSGGEAALPMLAKPNRKQEGAVSSVATDGSTEHRCRCQPGYTTVLKRRRKKREEKRQQAMLSF